MTPDRDAAENEHGRVAVVSAAWLRSTEGPGSGSVAQRRGGRSVEAVVQPLVERRGQVTRELDRVKSWLESLLELAEDRLVSKARPEAEQACLEAGLAAGEAEIETRLATVIDVQATAHGLRRLGDVFDELDDAVNRPRLLGACLKRVVLRPGQLGLRMAAIPLLAVPGNGAEGVG